MTKVQALKSVNLQNHEKQKVHVQALEKLQSPGQSQPDQEDLVDGHVSGLPLSVPRLDKWIAAVNALVDRASYSGVQGRVEAGSVGSALLAGGDSSSKVVRQMYACLGSRLAALDLARIKRAVSGSLAIDKGHGHVVVYGRMLCTDGIYDSWICFKRHIFFAWHIFFGGSIPKFVKIVLCLLLQGLVSGAWGPCAG